MNEDKNIKKGDKLTQADLERMDLLRKANEKVGRQLTIGEDAGNLEEVDELKQLIGKEFENPEEKYSLYYSGIRSLLMEHLPKGKENKELRDIIYDEKNIFLNLGKRKSDNNGVRKSDGRMTYQPVMNEILEIIIDWVSGSQNPFTLYKAFYQLNERHGYGHEEYDYSTVSVARAMMNLAE